ncbi:MAG: RNA polymerase sigma factor RpoD/SigA, partial [Gemmataceae bacterium]|nr:RNA polymerase sigma factor RpoD/SigA [Gemmataceae bacterium]
PALAAALAGVNPRSAAVIRQRFGLGGGPELTLQEIGDRLGRTRERVRQLEERGLAALRRGPRLARLESFADG